MPDRGKCRGCGAEVLWIHTSATNALIPLNVEPDPKGNVVIRDGKAVTLKKDDLFDSLVDGEKYMPHHATCPKVAEFRKTGE
jgi:hypothetical protein